MVMFHSYVSLPEGNWHVPVHTFNSCQFHESETWIDLAYPEPSAPRVQCQSGWGTGSLCLTASCFSRNWLEDNPRSGECGACHPPLGFRLLLECSMILNNTVVHHRNASKIQPREVIPVEINWGCTKFGPFHRMVYSTYHHFPFQPLYWWQDKFHWLQWGIKHYWYLAPPFCWCTRYFCCLNRQLFWVFVDHFPRETMAFPHLLYEKTRTS